MTRNNVVIGSKQTQKAILQGMVKQCYVAKDAEEKITNSILEMCNNNNVSVIHIDTMKELGRKFGVGVNAATAAELK